MKRGQCFEQPFNKVVQKVKMVISIPHAVINMKAPVQHLNDVIQDIDIKKKQIRANLLELSERNQIFLFHCQPCSSHDAANWTLLFPNLGQYSCGTFMFFSSHGTGRGIANSNSESTKKQAA